MSLFDSILNDIDDCISFIESSLSQNEKANASTNQESSTSTKPKQSKFRYLVVLDFEATCEENNRSFPNEIIEWPAIIIDLETLTVYNDPSDYFHVYVKPTVNPKLTPFCTALTGITQSMVDNGISIEEARERWNLWCYEHDLLPKDESGTPRACMVTCGHWDLNVMWTKQCKVSSFGKDEYAVLFSGWINIKLVFQQMFNRKKQKGMMEMLQHLEIQHIGRHHSGIDDVRNICNIVVELYRRDSSMFGDYNKTFKAKDGSHPRSTYEDACFARKMDELKSSK